MTKRSSTYLKGISETGDIANQTLFEDLIDSMGVVDSGTTFDDSGTITADSTIEYSTIRTVTGSTHTLTAATSGNVAGKYKKVRYTFDVDCTLTLTDFDETGSTLGTVNPIPAGTYDFWFFTTPFGLALFIQNNMGTSASPEFNTKSLLTNSASDNSYIDLLTTAGLYSWKSGASTTAGSISAWVKVTSFSNPVIIFSDNENSTTQLAMMLQISTSGVARFFMYQTGVTTSIRVDSSGLSLNTWYHVCVTWDTSNNVTGLNMYVNGSLDNAVKNGTTITEKGAINHPQIGINGFDDSCGDGYIDEVSFWNDELSLSEVQEIYNSGTPGNLLNHSNVANLHSWFRIEDNASDSSANGRNGSASASIVYSPDTP